MEPLVMVMKPLVAVHFGLPSPGHIMRKHLLEEFGWRRYIADEIYRVNRILAP